MVQFGNTTITINNYTVASATQFKAFCEAECKYAIAAYEVGESGTPHIQAYMQLKRRLSLNQLQELCCPTAHYEMAKGSAKHNQSYIRKGSQSHQEFDTQGVNGANYGNDLELFFEMGRAITKGQRTDLDEIARLNVEGASLQHIAETHPEDYIKFHKGIRAHRDAICQPRSTDTEKEIIVHIGPTGTGKTRVAHEAHPDAHMQGNELGKWWDGYDQHKVVIMEEFRGQVPFGYILRLCDRYPMKVEFKGGCTEFLADKIIFTAPEHPGLWYAKLEQRDGKMAQFKRRISKILKFSALGEDPVDITDEPWPTPEEVGSPGQGGSNDPFNFGPQFGFE